MCTYKHGHTINTCADTHTHGHTHTHTDTYAMNELNKCVVYYIQFRFAVKTKFI